MSVEERTIERRGLGEWREYDQLLEKRRVAMEMFEDPWDATQIDGQGFESMNMGDDRSKGVVDRFIAVISEVSGHSTRATNAYAGLPESN